MGDIRPANIFLSEEGQVKIANAFSWPSEIPNYQKTILNREETYLAPEEVEGLREGKLHLNIDEHLAESFSIGLTMLETGGLQRAYSLYLNKKFNKPELESMIRVWENVSIDEDKSKKKTYSRLLKHVVIALCEVETENRVSAQELYEWLCPFDADISNLRPFSPPPPPHKVKLPRMEIVSEF